MESVLSPEELQTLRVEGYADPIFFFRFFLPDWYTSPLGWLHRGIVALLLRRADFLLNFGEEDWAGKKYVWTQGELEKLVKWFSWKENPEDTTEEFKPIFKLTYEDGIAVHIEMLVSDKVQLMIPRGVGKTTVVNGVNIIKIVYKERNFLLYVSETATHAEIQLGNVKRQLEANSKLRAVFGNLVPARTDVQKWTEDHIETLNGVKVIAKGQGSQVRGLNVNGDRPDDVTADDLENRDEAKNDTNRKKLKEWFKADLEPVLPQMGEKHGTINMLGTLVHEDSLLLAVAKDPEWITIRFGALDPNGEPVAPFYMTKQQYERKKLGYARTGQLHIFHMEYGSEIRFDDDSKKFHVSKIKIQIMERTVFVGVGQAMDPAISEDRHADSATIGIVGITERGRLHVLDVWGQVGVHPRELIDKFFEMHFRWDPTKHGIEAIAYQRALVFLAQEEMFRRGKQWGPKAYFEIEPIKHGKLGKIERVEGVLATRYSAGYFTHQQHFPMLETQLSDWPNGKKDYPDVIAMATTLLVPYAALAFEVDTAPDGAIIDSLAKDQYPPLEEVIGGEWRTAP